MVSKNSPPPPPPLPSTARGKMSRILIKPRPECVPSAPTQQLPALQTSGLGNSTWLGVVCVWQQQGARREGREETEGTRARGGLLGQNQEAGQSGHIPFPLADELSIQNAGEGRERHLFFIGGSNEHAESVPVVGQFQDVVVMAVRGGKLSWERHQDGALAITPVPVDSNPALAFPLVLQAPPSALKANSPSWLLRLPTHPPAPSLPCSLFLYICLLFCQFTVSSGGSLSLVGHLYLHTLFPNHQLLIYSDPNLLNLSLHIALPQEDLRSPGYHTRTT